MVLMEDDEMVLPAVIDVLPGQTDTDSVPLPPVLPQQTQVVDFTISSTSLRPVVQHPGRKIQLEQVQHGQGKAGEIFKSTTRNPP